VNTGESDAIDEKLAALTIGTLWLVLAVLLGEELQHDPGLGAQY
jgi:hypothetical protein